MSSIDLTGIFDPTYNEPVKSVLHDGEAFILLTENNHKFHGSFKNLQDCLMIREGLKRRVDYYQSTVDSGPIAKEYEFAKRHIDIAKRWLLVYDRIYIPTLRSEEKAIQQAAFTNEIHPQLSLF